MTTLTRLASVSLGSLLLACGPNVATESNADADTDSSTSGHEDVNDGSSGGERSTGSTLPDSTSTSTNPTSSTDPTGSTSSGTNSSSSSGTIVQDGCGRIDFLFIIDNSGSMADYQKNLTANFPVFIDAIETTIDQSLDVHIMVVDTDPAEALECAETCEQVEEDGCLIEPSGQCNVSNPVCTLACVSMMECDAAPGGCEDPLPSDPCDVMGAGINFPTGQGASNQECNFSSGERYIDATEPDLASAFSCAATVGVGATGATEQPIGSLIQAITPGTDAHTCNTDFLRDDAILVVTFITDEDDDEKDGSPGTVAGWRQALIAAKNGNEDAIVVLGLFGNDVCAEESPRLGQFVDSWGDRGLRDSVCLPSYADFFEEAAGIIDTTCGDFEPASG